ncbi:UNVERIFIED_CONTAM: hypothetical protein Sradi_0611100 [Sesamum radiatum]|uniref:Secreted protein n=1 Tax=Sesamum radiatum TaxID=300843 RepID=A0AAW2VPW9_SESRA
MASTAQSLFALFSSTAAATTTNLRRMYAVRCGPRDNRGPLLKRPNPKHRSNPSNSIPQARLQN